MNRLVLCLLVAGLIAVAGCAAKPETPAGPQAVQPAQPKPPTSVAPAEQPKPPTPVAPAQQPTPVKVVAGKELSLAPTKDVRVFCHSSEADFNGGTGGRLRTAPLSKSSAEVTLMDFDRAAIKAYLDANKGKPVVAKLTLCVYEVQNGPGKLEVAALDTASDWIEGTRSQVQAEKGEPCCNAAQFGVKPWTTADGKSVANLPALLYDKKANKIKTLLNSTGVEVADKAAKGTVIEIVLDAAFVEHLASSETCKGIVLFNRTEASKIDVCSREQSKMGPKLILSVK